MARKFPNKGMLGRTRQGFKTAKPKIVVVCEGKLTEPSYFKDFTDHYNNPLVTVTTVGGCGVPISVVERAIDEKRQLVTYARQTKDSYDQQFEVWAVFDRDEHPKVQVPRALQLARDNDIRVAYSNPCFELWGLMHFSCVAKPGSHQQTQRELKRVLPGFCHERHPVMNFELLAGRYPKAVSNSVRALRDRENEGRAHSDPSTSVHLLTEQIRLFGRS